MLIELSNEGAELLSVVAEFEIVKDIVCDDSSSRLAAVNDFDSPRSVKRKLNKVIFTYEIRVNERLTGGTRVYKSMCFDG